MNPASPVLPNQEHREITYAKDQPEYLPLPAIVMQGVEKEVLTRWELTNEEKIALLSGGQIYLSLWTFGGPLQPIRLRVAHPEEIIAEYGMVSQPPSSPVMDTKEINSIEPISPEVEKALDEKFGKECEYEH